MEKRFESYARLAAISFLLIGCFYVLRPFLAAMLFAVAVTISSWPMYQALLARMKGHRTLAAGAMTLLLILIIIMPLALVTYHLAIDAGRMVEYIKIAVDAGSVAPPAWLKGIPLVGAMLDGYINKIIGSPEELLALAKSLLEPARHYVLGGGILLGSGVAQTSLAVFVSFFLYRDGEHLLHVLAAGMQRILGDSTAGVLLTVNRTVSGVMYGMLGTALAQATVAMLGFLIAGVPAVLLLGGATLLLSLVPVGPPLIWGGVAIWLFDQGRNGSAIFMLLWGFFLISSVDNVIKPMLISRGSSLPFLLVLLGVLGGVIAFGFVGLFIGPTLLAIAYGLLRNWIGIAAEQL